MIAKCKDEVGIKAIDFYSIGHIVLGYILFLVFSVIFFVLFNDYIPFFALVYAVEIGILWELFENYILDKTYLKFEIRKDSITNSFADVVFNLIGGFFGLILIIYLTFILVLLITIIYLVWSILLMEVFSKRTLNKENHD